MHISLSLAIILLLTPVLGSLYPRDAYERLHARKSHYAELEARQAYQQILAREAYAHPEIRGHGFGIQSRRARGTPRRARNTPSGARDISSRARGISRRARGIPNRVRGTPSYTYPRKRLRVRMPPPPSSTLESVREADTPPASDASGPQSAAVTRAASPFAHRESPMAFARPPGTGGLTPHSDQPGRGDAGAGPSSGASGDPPKRKLSMSSADTPPTDERHSSGGGKHSGSDLPRVSSIKTSGNGGSKGTTNRVSFGAMTKSESTGSLKGSLFGMIGSELIHGAGDLAKAIVSGSSKKHRSGSKAGSSHGGTTRADSLHAGASHSGASHSANDGGGGSPTASKASKSTIHSAGSSPGAANSGSESDHRGKMGARPDPLKGAGGVKGKENTAPSAPPLPPHPGGGSVAGSRRKKNGSRNGPGGGPRRHGDGTGTGGVKKGKHPHLERPPKKLSSTKPWNAAMFGLTAAGAGVAGVGGIFGADAAIKGANAAVISAQAGQKIANASMLSAEAGIRGANAAALSAQAGMKGADASQLSAEAGMKSANAAMINSQQAIKSANASKEGADGTQLIAAVNQATAEQRDNVSTAGAVAQAQRAGAWDRSKKKTKQKRSYPPVVLYYDW